MSRATNFINVTQNRRQKRTKGVASHCFVAPLSNWCISTPFPAYWSHLRYHTEEFLLVLHTSAANGINLDESGRGNDIKRPKPFPAGGRLVYTSCTAVEKTKVSKQICTELILCCVSSGDALQRLFEKFEIFRFGETLKREKLYQLTQWSPFNVDILVFV